ncbi:hypothetical protein ACH5RR_036455 [Cinchona calisaya]|uniref:Uncharacterized protein n=1 Tax=Cinchona calisaya TaxID=153742 RepID=A0ABD2Y4P9_9GENT
MNPNLFFAVDLNDERNMDVKDSYYQLLMIRRPLLTMEKKKNGSFKSTRKGALIPSKKEEDNGLRMNSDQSGSYPLAFTRQEPLQQYSPNSAHAPYTFDTVVGRERLEINQ